MIYMIFSTYSSGSTYLQKELSKYIVVPRRKGLTVVEAEFGLLNWAAKYVYAPHETIDHDPIRTFDPKTGKENKEWRKNFKKYLISELGLPNLETIEVHFLETHVRPYVEKYRLPKPVIGLSKKERKKYVIEVFNAFSRQKDILVKNPKWLNDFSGYTVKLLEALIAAKIPIKGIFLYRSPFDSFSSMIERQFRLDEIFAGDMGRYVQYVYDSVNFSAMMGIKLAKKYGFLQIKYEKILDQFDDLAQFMGITNYKELSFRKKYMNRYILNPYTRQYFQDLLPISLQLGYKYPEKVKINDWIKELIYLFRQHMRNSPEYVNNPESLFMIIKKIIKFEGMHKGVIHRNYEKKISVKNWMTTNNTRCILSLSSSFI